MVHSSDLLSLPYTPDLSQGGIAYACRSLAYTYDRMGGSPVERLRRIAAGVAVELALRRYLGEQEVPFDVLGATPFTDPDRYDLSLGGRRCDVKSYLITRRRQVSLLRDDPALALGAPALVPLDQFAAEGHKPGDLYLFAFLLGLVAASFEDMEKAAAAGQPVYLIHPLPGEWARPANWLPLEGLALKSECEAPVNVEIGGQDEARSFVTARLELSPRQRTVIDREFYSLAYVHAERRPEARLGLHSPRRGAPYLIASNEWGNIWVYGMRVLFTGWLTHEEFRRKASVLNAGQPTFQYARTRTRNLQVPMAELNPLGELFEKIKAWEAQKEPPGTQVL
jgi:hypothetical protein